MRGIGVGERGGVCVGGMRGCRGEWGRGNYTENCRLGAWKEVSKSDHKNYPLNPLNAPSASRQALISQSAEASEGRSDFEGFNLDDGEFSSSGELYSDEVSTSDEEAA